MVFLVRLGSIVWLINEKFFDKFVEFKQLVEKKSGQFIKVIKSNNGGEYRSNMFLYYCRGHGIQREFTTSYTPQQIGVVERKNRTIVEMA